MRTQIRLPLAAAFLVAGLSLANAQTAADYNAHHAATQAAPTDAGKAPAAPGNGGPMMGTGPMKCGGMDQMAQMMQMMGGTAGLGVSTMMPFAHVEGRIAFLKAELHVTDAQASQWNAFADVLRAAAKTSREAMDKVSNSGEAMTATARLDAMVTKMTARLEGIKAVADAEKALYAVLTDEQKAVADELLLGAPTGMRTGGRGD